MAAWAGVALVMAVPVVLAALSPWLAYRGPAYIAGGFAGIVALALLFAQPLLAAGYLPGPGLAKERGWHRWVGAAVVFCVVAHVAGLYITSPQDTMDALLLVAPTPFSVYGVIALAGIVATAAMVALRRRMGLRYPAWRLIHNGVAAVVVVATVVHALQIEGAMEPWSKWGLSVAVLAATGVVLVDLRVVRRDGGTA